jgi:hypothetical protein
VGLGHHAAADHKQHEQEEEQELHRR